MGSSSLFSGVTSGLNGAFSILTTASSGSVTASSISSAMSNSTYASSLNSGFASYILSNFATLDTDGDGIINATEVSNLSNSIARSGMTASQLTQLGKASGLSEETLEQVLEHFADIDANNDGKVTSAEISGYKITSAMETKKDEFTNKMAANQSLFYGEDSTGTDSSSLLAYKRWGNSGASSSGKSSGSSGSNSSS